MGNEINVNMEEENIKSIRQQSKHYTTLCKTVFCILSFCILMFGFGDIGKVILSSNDIEYTQQPKDKLLEVMQNMVLDKETFANEAYKMQLLFLFVCATLCISWRYDTVKKDKDKLEVKEKNLEKSLKQRPSQGKSYTASGELFSFLCSPFMDWFLYWNT